MTAATAAAAAERPPSGAERLLRAAVAAGVEVCFANPGKLRMGPMALHTRLCALNSLPACAPHSPANC